MTLTSRLVGNVYPSGGPLVDGAGVIVAEDGGTRRGIRGGGGGGGRVCRLVRGNDGINIK